MALGKQIKFYREKKGLSLTDLANLVGDMTGKNVEPASIRAIEIRDSNSSKYTPQIASILGLTIEQLMDETRDYTEMPPCESAPSSVEYAPIPIVNARACCGNGYINDNVEILGNFALPRKMLKDMGVSPNNAEIVFAYSFSMFPTIRNGSHVLIDKADKEPKDGKIYAICIDNQLLLKRLFRQSGTWIMRSDNQDKNEFPDRPLPAEETTRIYGRVIWYDIKL